ncbi:bacteriocin-associated integral membrane family protein [Staphylococcus auricularis]|nr:DUF1430 domain-containing protein [Staphylococcus auricularis]QPT05292.1 DUF1430 domain-containing protein [Staphylococcus auricularis]BCU52339.1 bacteriocin-associated integral membrane family protein [Staphylococcus auricularis]SQJ11718.1 membrane spanning protein [Staphylococcus auricularis]
MKIFKLVLDIVTLLMIAMLIFVNSIKEAEEILSGSDAALSIDGWDQRVNKAEIFKKIKEIGEKENISIYKEIHENTNDDKKYLYAFNKDKADVFKNDFIESVSYDHALSKDVRGSYFITGEHNVNSRLVEVLKENGVESQLYHMNRPLAFIEFITDEGLIFPILSLIIIYIFYYLHNASMNYKSFGIKKLHGYGFTDIMLQRLKQGIVYYILLLLLFFPLVILVLYVVNPHFSKLYYLSILSIGILIYLFINGLIYFCSYILYIKTNIPLIIKGKRPFMVLRLFTLLTKGIILIILSLLLIQNIGFANDIKKIKSTEKYWDKLDDYYILEIAPVHLPEDEEIEMAKKLEKMVQHTEKYENSLLIYQNNISNPSIEDLNLDTGNILVINDNFKQLYGDVFNQYSLNSTGKDEVDVLLPPETLESQNDIENNIKEWIYIQQDNGAVSKSLNVTRAKDDYSIYNYDTRTELTNSFSYKPLVIKLKAEDLGYYFHYSTISQAKVLFKDFQKVKENLKQFELENNISGITNYKDHVVKTFQEIRTKSIYVSLSMFLGILTLLFTIIFDVQQYFEQNKKKLLVQKMHGFSIINNHIYYLLISNGLVAVIGIMLTVIFSSEMLIMLFLIILLVQFILQLISIYYIEQKSLISIKETE